MKESKDDKYLIYQLKNVPEARDIRYHPLDFLRHFNINTDKINDTIYECVYSGVLNKGVSLEDIFYRFNCDIPDDFKGHSLSVSDVIVIQPAKGKATAYYCDSFSFVELKQFLSENYKLDKSKQVSSCNSL